jgi:hypothetical protein
MRTRRAARALRTLLALAALRCSAALDTSGYAPPGGDDDNVAGGRVRVGAGVPGVTCAASASDLAPLLSVTLEPDVAAWRPGGAAAGAAGTGGEGAPFRIDAFERLVREGANRFEGERLVLIHNNSRYYFAHARASAVAARRGSTPEASVPFVSPWVSATQWWFEEAVAVWNMTFPGARLPAACCVRALRCEHPAKRMRWRVHARVDPNLPLRAPAFIACPCRHADCVFHMDVNDEGYCVPPRVCAAPSFAFWRAAGSGATDILLPYLLGVNHRRVGRSVRHRTTFVRLFVRSFNHACGCDVLTRARSVCARAAHASPLRAARTTCRGRRRRRARSSAAAATSTRARSSSWTR